MELSLAPCITRTPSYVARYVSYRKGYHNLREQVLFHHEAYSFHRLVGGPPNNGEDSEICDHNVSLSAWSGRLVPGGRAEAQSSRCYVVRGRCDHALRVFSLTPIDLIQLLYTICSTPLHNSPPSTMSSTSAVNAPKALPSPPGATTPETSDALHTPRRALAGLGSNARSSRAHLLSPDESPSLRRSKRARLSKEPTPVPNRGPWSKCVQHYRPPPPSLQYHTLMKSLHGFHYHALGRSAFHCGGLLPRVGMCCAST